MPDMPTKTPVRRWASKDVMWFRGFGAKRPIAYSTVADRDALELLGDDGLTFNEAAAHPYIGDDARAVCRAYIARGLGDTRLSSLGIVSR